MVARRRAAAARHPSALPSRLPRSQADQRYVRRATHLRTMQPLQPPVRTCGKRSYHSEHILVRTRPRGVQDLFARRRILFGLQSCHLPVEVLSQSSRQEKGIANRRARCHLLSSHRAPRTRPFAHHTAARGEGPRLTCYRRSGPGSRLRAKLPQRVALVASSRGATMTAPLR